MPKQPFTTAVIEAIQAIPEGKVSTYGGIASMAGNPRAARQVARILHSCSEKEGLPWWRVVNREGRIALKTEWAYAEQAELLETEGIELTRADRIDLKTYEWRPIT